MASRRQRLAEPGGSLVEQPQGGIASLVLVGEDDPVHAQPGAPLGRTLPINGQFVGAGTLRGTEPAPTDWQLPDSGADFHPAETGGRQLILTNPVPREMM